MKEKGGGTVNGYNGTPLVARWGGDTADRKKKQNSGEKKKGQREGKRKKGD